MPGTLAAPASLCHVILVQTTPKGTLPGGQAAPMQGTGQETSALQEEQAGKQGTFIITKANPWGQKADQWLPRTGGWKDWGMEGLGGWKDWGVTAKG